MALSSAIEWTEATWQVTSGCSRVSEGCRHCYAETMANRIAGMAKADIAKGRDPKGKRSYLNVIGDNGQWNNRIELLPQNLQIPLKRKAPTVWFVNSMSDLFHEGVPFEFVDKVFAVMALTPQHTYQILTKRPERMAEYLRTVQDAGAKSDIFDHLMFMGRSLPTAPGAMSPNAESRFMWPLPNCWLGTSVEDQKRADERIPHLLRCPAAVRFLSCEPLLGPVNIFQSFGFSRRNPDKEIEADDSVRSKRLIDWCIVGGESGAGARDCDVSLVQSLIGQCKALGIDIFIKQLGAKVYDENTTSAAHFEPDECWPDGTKTDYHRVLLKDHKGGDMAEWPVAMRLRQMPSPAGSAVRS